MNGHQLESFETMVILLEDGNEEAANLVDRVRNWYTAVQRSHRWIEIYLNDIWLTKVGSQHEFKGGRKPIQLRWKLLVNENAVLNVPG